MTSPLQPLFPEERRWATVLFAEVGGLSKLSNRLDFSAFSKLIKDVWLRLDEVIWKYGGFIDKHFGDGVMAVWGAPYVGENDTERAVSAGLALLESLEKFARESNIPGAKDLVLRIGINTGSVLTGYVGKKDEYSILGDTVNTAQRLEQTAESGQVLISESAYRIVQGDFKIKPFGAIDLKDDSEPVQAFVVIDKRQYSTKVRYQSEDILITRMVAREYELQRLSAAYNQVVNLKKPAFILINGEPGIGKSRLILEFVKQLDESDPTLFLMSTRALVQTSRASFFVWKSLWQNRFGILDGDTSDVSRDKFVKGMQEIRGNLDDAEFLTEATHLIGSFMGFSWPGSPYLEKYQGNPEAKADKVFNLTKNLFTKIAELGPVVIVVDDLQWADTLSLDLIKCLISPEASKCPLLILTAAQTDFMSNAHPRITISENIHLNPIPTNPEVVKLAYPEIKEFPEIVLNELAKRSGGNPLYLEEMVKAFIKSGLVNYHPTPDEVLLKLHQNTPGTIQDILQSRIDSLPKGARTIALIASVIGRVFWVGPVLAAVRSASYTGTGLLKLRTPMIERVVQDGLKKLVQSELAFPRAGTHFSEDQEYIFKHDIFRDTTYCLIPKKYLPQYHLATARWLVGRHDSKYKVMAADHFDKAGALREASRYYEMASRESKMRGATQNAQWLLLKSENIMKLLDEQN